MSGDELLRAFSDVGVTVTVFLGSYASSLFSHGIRRILAELKDMNHIMNHIRKGKKPVG